MPEAAAEDTGVHAENDDGIKGQETDPQLFTVGEEEPDSPPKETQAPVAEEPKTDDKTSTFEKEIEELKRQNEKLQRTINFRFAERRHKEKEAKESEQKPQFTDAQLLKIMEEHRDDPAVLLQVMKHVGEANATKAKKEAVEDATITNQKSQAEAWLKQNLPELYDESSDLRAKTDEMRSLMRLESHPLGDFLAVAAAQTAAMPEMLKQAREDERKKVLAEMAENSRKQAIKGGGPAGGKGSPAPAAVGDAEYLSQGKAIGLKGDALKLYVQMRKQAKNQSRVMEA